MQEAVSQAASSEGEPDMPGVRRNLHARARRFLAEDPENWARVGAAGTRALAKGSRPQGAFFWGMRRR
eukprot:456686-Lingulodinium_polyedra.AAC.1